MSARDTTIATVHNVVQFSRRKDRPAVQSCTPPGHAAYRTALAAMLNQVLATELVCVLRYRRYFFISKHSLIDKLKPSFLRYAQVRQEQADRVAERIVQLGGAPQFDPSDLAARSRSRYGTDMDLQDMVGEDLLFVRSAIESCHEVMRDVATQDSTTAQMLAEILALHEEHAEALAALLIGLTPPLRVPS